MQSDNNQNDVRKSLFIRLPSGFTSLGVIFPAVCLSIAAVTFSFCVTYRDERLFRPRGFLLTPESKQRTFQGKINVFSDKPRDESESLSSSDRLLSPLR